MFLTIFFFSATLFMVIMYEISIWNLTDKDFLLDYRHLKYRMDYFMIIFNLVFAMVIGYYYCFMRVTLKRFASIKMARMTTSLTTLFAIELAIVGVFSASTLISLLGFWHKLVCQTTVRFMLHEGSIFTYSFFLIVPIMLLHRAAFKQEMPVRWSERRTLPMTRESVEYENLSDNEAVEKEDSSSEED